MAFPSGRVSRIDEPVVWVQADGRSADYVDAFVLAPINTSAKHAEGWLRTVLEDAPRGVRWLLLGGWLVVLGFRPGSRSPERILGWRIVETAPEEVVIEQRSWLMTAHLALRVGDRQQLVWRTQVVYKNRAAQLIWPVLGIVHRPMVRYLLSRVRSPVGKIAAAYKAPLITRTSNSCRIRDRRD
jgi:hypothetical protein